MSLVGLAALSRLDKRLYSSHAGLGGDSGVDVNRLQSIHGKTRVTVKGDVGPRIMDYVRGIHRAASAAVEYTMSLFGIYPERGRHKTMYLDADLEPNENDRGYTGGYTHGGNAITMNPCFIPGTGYYYRFKTWLAGVPGRFGRYLRQKFRTQEKVGTEFYESTVHEESHNQLQLNRIRAEGGKMTENPFYEDLFFRLAERYKPKWGKLAPLIAYLFPYRRILEGLNVGTQKEVGGMNAYEVHQEARNDPTTYGKHTYFTAAGLLKKGYDSALGFYRHWANRAVESVRAGKGVIDNLIDGFFDSYRERHPLHDSLVPAPVNPGANRHYHI